MITELRILLQYLVGRLALGWHRKMCDRTATTQLFHGALKSGQKSTFPHDSFAPVSERSHEL